MRIRDCINKLTAYTPGEQPANRSAVKLNTNENPYQPSPAVGGVLAGFNLDDLRRYPDPCFAALRKRIAEIHSTTPERVFIGNGSDEILALATRAFVEDSGTIGSFNPSYSLYKTLAAIRNVKFKTTELPGDFSWTEPDASDTDLFLLTNPNAPTSVRYPDEKIATFAKKYSGVLIIDEAYADFSLKTCMPIATASGNDSTIVMRTLSKSFSLAGLRLGYCVGPEPLIQALFKIKDSYNIDALAQHVALAALNDLNWMKSNTEKIIKTREDFSSELRKRGWVLPESSTNFVFARPPASNAKELFLNLKQRDIHVRYFPGDRTGDRLRITIGTDGQMETLLKAIDEISSKS